MTHVLRQSAYGLGFRGLPVLEELADSDGGVAEHVVEVEALPSIRAPRQLRPLDAEAVVRRLHDGRVLALCRETRSATLFGTAIESRSWAHPYLGPIATTFSRWHGREAFHAGAFVAAGRAWVVLGSPTAGKSTLLAALARRGLAVLSDDIVVTDGSDVFPGPRCVDLRDRLPGDRTQLRRVRSDSRWRIPLPGSSGPVPVGGWLFLHWGERLSVRPVEASELLGRLARRRSWGGLASDPAVLLSLAALPTWDLTRPRSWARLEATLELVAETVSGLQGVRERCLRTAS